MNKMKIMEEALFKKVKIVTPEGNTIKGEVKVFETPYDNDGEEASICVLTDDKEGICFYESDIEDIEIN